MEPGAEPFHRGRLADGYGRLDAFPEHAQIFGMREVIVKHQRILVRVVAPEQYAATALGPQQHREHAEHVLVVQVTQQFVVEIVPQTVRLFRRRTAVRVGRRGRQHELDVRPIVRLVTVLGRDERHGLQAYGRRQRAFSQHGVPAGTKSV